MTKKQIKVIDVALNAANDMFIGMDITRYVDKIGVKVSIHKGDGVPLSTKASFNFEVRH